MQAAKEAVAAGFKSATQIINEAGGDIDELYQELSEELALADAWIAASLPGSEGEGVADVLFGNAPFVGTLSFAWPRNLEQVPLSALQADDEAPLFPIGHGITTGTLDDYELSFPTCGE